MALSEERLRGYIRRLLLSRMRLLCNHGFFGLLLMHMKYAVDEELETACTDGERIVFGVEFLESLSDAELDFVMMHEVLHVALMHCTRGQELDRERFNIACDIVVNSNILLENGGNAASITLSRWGESMHVAPDGHEGSEYTAEEVYAMLSSPPKKKKAAGGGRADSNPQGRDALKPRGGARWDDHSAWERIEDPSTLRDVWKKRVLDAAEAIRIRESSTSRGLLPLCAARLVERLTRPVNDWRVLLNDFVQQEICDYTLLPPDRRRADSPFFLPDFGEAEEKVENILFMIDTSGSVSDAALAAAYSEIKGAIEQFNGRLCGYLGFFDAAVVEPLPFGSVEDLKKITPAGGGGTDFGIVFEYVFSQMTECLPCAIVILTDGYAPYPKKQAAHGIPVLWLLSSTDVTPPWGRVARLPS